MFLQPNILKGNPKSVGIIQYFINVRHKQANAQSFEAFDYGVYTKQIFPKI
jgi:hypothetical protein